MAGKKVSHAALRQADHDRDGAPDPGDGGHWLHTAIRSRTGDDTGADCRRTRCHSGGRRRYHRLHADGGSQSDCHPHLDASAHDTVGDAGTLSDASAYGNHGSAHGNAHGRAVRYSGGLACAA